MVIYVWGMYINKIVGFYLCSKENGFLLISFKDWNFIFEILIFFVLLCVGNFEVKIFFILYVSIIGKKYKFNFLD